VSEYPSGSVEDRKMLETMPNSKLLDFFFLQVRNLWRVDGLYFLGIEKKFGVEAAAEIDAGVWEVMAAIEARGLRKLIQTSENPNIPQVIDLLRMSSWALDQPFKTIEISDKKAVLWVKKCRTQETRLNKGLAEFPCKNVRHGYLKNFAKTLNPEVKVNCSFCPPDKHPKDSWCEWEFTL
jgi:hypothetical protein